VITVGFVYALYFFPASPADWKLIKINELIIRNLLHKMYLRPLLLSPALDEGRRFNFDGCAGRCYQVIRIPIVPAIPNAFATMNSTNFPHVVLLSKSEVDHCQKLSKVEPIDLPYDTKDSLPFFYLFHVGKDLGF